MAGPLANAAAKGITVFVASGDYGSQAVNSTNPAFQIVSTDYPSVNANVIAVGGTNLTLYTNNTRNTETVYNSGGASGGGGVSSMISRPAWQTGLTYKTVPDNTVSNLTSRGIPDISAPMNAYGLWLNGNILGVGGTSGAAPIMAGMVARFISLNGGRRPPPESLNSLFYNNTGSFLDIQIGNNASLLATGYSATVGWDAAIGLGPQANAIQTYQAVTTGGLRIKTASNTWSPVQSIKVKTAANTWTTVNRVWTKTASGWLQTY
jgi:tripeptidyl-peptidase-1